MTTNNQEQFPSGQEQNNSGIGPGNMLREAREARGWSQQEVARRLNLRLAVIESIDQDHYKAGVALTFLRGYVKAYAKLVGVNEQQTLAAFDGMAGMAQLRSAGPAPMQSFSKKTRQQASDKWLKLISWLVVLGLVASLVFWWWQNSGTGYDFSESPSMADEPVLTQAPLAEPAVPVTEVLPEAGAEQAPVAGAEPETAETVSVPVAVNDEPVADEASAEPVEQASPVVNEVTPEADPELLVLGFNADCWIKITDAEGRVLSEGVKTASDRLELKGKPPFRLVLGAPQAASVEYLNKVVDLSSFRAGRVARLTVPQS
ncbi:DUF4115 domain-containing protein [Oceanimonas baumannii]|uniref:RodZ domain-containing protein n=1 Tax=Oceanimonas baumannii TaxID=129578 RepID=UPI001D183345|nr:RodZ domain-containing protein [Oceanimonas baumannii]MCC4265324.1 DUF4115 domain-containing protein [Oceanimonas baumannii]